MGMDENKETKIEDQKSEYNFIHEEVKKVPFDKKKAACILVLAAVAALLFGTIAAFVFNKVSQKLEKKPERPAVVISGDEEESEAGEEETSAPAPEEHVSEPEPSDEPLVVKQDMTLVDYQYLLDELYGVGRNASKSVVSITSRKSTMDWYDTAYETEGLGAGIIIADNDYSFYIVTEKKLISDAESIVVNFYNGLSASGQMIAYDGTTGIAVVRVDKSEFDNDDIKDIEPIPIGASGTAVTGKLVIAIGSPLGEPYSVLTGNIIASGEYISASDANYKILSTDIASTPTASGALIDINGSLIGLIMQDYSRSDSTNMLTALAIGDIKEVIERLSNGNSIAYLGIQISTVTSDISEEYDIPSGVYIKSVAADSPAMESGLQVGDVITKVNQNEINTYQQYQKWILDAAVGQQVSMTVMRMGSDGHYSEVICDATLGRVK